MRINGKMWIVRAVDAKNRHLTRSDGEYVLGACDNAEKTIWVRDDLTGRMLDKVLLHEITHAFCFEYHVTFDIDTEEIICDYIATYARNIINTTDKIFKEYMRYGYAEIA
jgi:hypothetical protein